MHPKCSGLIKKENTKIEKLIKEKKINYYFKCIKCCFKSIITSGILQTEELSSLLSNIELDFTKTLLSLTTPIKTTVQSENSVNNNTPNTKNWPKRLQNQLKSHKQFPQKKEKTISFNQQEIQKKIK